MSEPNLVRLVDLLAPLSLVTDLGMGQPAEDAMRACFLGTGLARRMGLSEEDASHVFYTTLLRHVGCTASADYLRSIRRRSSGVEQPRPLAPAPVLHPARPA